MIYQLVGVVIGVIIYFLPFTQTNFFLIQDPFLFSKLFISKYQLMDRRELSNIKRQLFEMLQLAGRPDDDNYNSLMETLDQLNFKDYTLELYATQLVGVINEMYDLDNLAFEHGMMDRFMEQLRN